MSIKSTLKKIPLVKYIIKHRDLEKQLFLKNEQLKELLSWKEQTELYNSDDVIRFKKEFADFGYKIARNKNQVIVKKNKSSFVINGGSGNDIAWMSREVFIHKVYDFFPHKQQDDWIAIDIGLNIGLTSLFLSNKKRFKKIYSFEPFLSTYRLAEKNLNKNPDLKKKIKTFNFALEDEDRKATVFFNKDLLGSMSLIEDRFANNNKLTQETVLVKQASPILQKIIDKHLKKQSIFLKIDCEGGETKILKDLDKNKILSKINVIILEYHFGNYQELINILNKNNFFCFHQSESTKIGMIKAVNLKHKLHT